MVSITKKIVDCLITYHSKFRLLMDSNFMRHFNSQKGLKLHQEFYPKLKSGRILLKEPSEEVIDSFILHFRQFHLARDAVSPKYLEKYILKKISTDFDTETKNIKNYIRDFKESLKKNSPIKLNIILNGKKFNLNTHKDYINTMIYGGKIHSSPGSIEKLYYDYFHKNSEEGFKPITKRYFRFNVYSIIFEETHILGLIYNEINTILRKLIDIFKKNGKELKKKKDFNDALKYFKNALYITNQLEFQRTKVEILEEILGIHKILKDLEEIRKIKDQIRIIKDSIQQIPQDFYNDPFFSEFFKSPIQFEQMFNQVLPDIGLNDKPIVILNVERIHELKKFENHLNMKYFTYEINRNKLLLSYSIAIGKLNDLILYVDKKEEINLDHKFGLTFVYPDLSCFIILSNDPKMALLDYIYARGASSLDPLTHLYHNKFLEFILSLIKIELNQGTQKPKFDDIKDIFNCVINIDEMRKYIRSIIWIEKRLIQISYFPRIIRKVELTKEIESLRKAIENDADKELIGQALFSYTLSIYLYSVLTNEARFLESKTEFNELFKILDLINGKRITNDFLSKLLKFLDQNFEIYRKKNIA
ncbi:MAG: hypothetical protein ACFFG0_38875 [Candidatus Thorarchaeota archaeon]